jgi:hypothetical protein
MITGRPNATAEIRTGRQPEPARNQIAHETASSIGITAQEAM